MAFPITLLFLFGIASASGHLVNTSIIVSIHKFPDVVSIIGPTMSMATV
jgi:hypothetical protein